MDFGYFSLSSSLRVCVCVSGTVNVWMASGDSLILAVKTISNATYIHNALAFRGALRVQA